MSHLTLRATSCGPLARLVLHEGSAGCVVAVFERSFYIRCAEGLACIGDASLLPGPLNLVTDAGREMRRATNRLRTEAPWRVSDCAIQVHGGLRILFNDTPTWRPSRIVSRSSNAQLRHGIASLRREVHDRVPVDGLGKLGTTAMTATDDRPLMAMARLPVQRLREWLVKSVHSPGSVSVADLRPLRRLIGLGPGLTPSGDDLLAGVMIALHGFGREDTCRNLWQRIRPWATETQNLISIAHLCAAAEGLGAAAIHHLLQAMQTNRHDQMARILDDVDTLGHTSGWDALAGMLIAIDALLEVYPSPCPGLPPSEAA